MSNENERNDKLNPLRSSISKSKPHIQPESYVMASITGIREETPTAKVVSLYCQGHVVFHAGQYLCFYKENPDLDEELVVFPGTYSVSSPPSLLPRVEILVQDSSNPRNLCHYLHRLAKLGETFWVSTVGYGTVAITGEEMVCCPLSWNGGNGGILMMAGGYAPSAPVSIAHALFERQDAVIPAVTLLHSVRKADNIPFFKNTIKLQAEHSNFSVIHTVTAGSLDDGWHGRRGRFDINELRTHIPGKQLFCVFGSPAFCHGIVDMLIKLGVWPGNIRSDYSTRVDSSSRQTENQTKAVTNPVAPKLHARDTFLEACGLDQVINSLSDAVFEAQPGNPLSFSIHFLQDAKERSANIPEINNIQANSPAFWIDYWQTNAITWQNPEVSPWLRQYQDEFLSMPSWCGDEKRLTVFVPLCGKSVDLWHLLSVKNVEVIGNDCSGIACADFFSEFSIPGYERVVINEDITLHRSTVLPLRLYEGDIFALTSQIVGRVDRVLDRAALVALHPSNIETKYMPLMCSLLSEEGSMLLASVSELPSPTAPPHCYTATQIESVLTKFFRRVEHKMDYRYKLDAGYVVEPIYLLKHKIDRSEAPGCL